MLYSRSEFRDLFLELILAVWWLVWVLGLGENGDLILWLIMRASEELVIKAKEHSCNTS